MDGCRGSLSTRFLLRRLDSPDTGVVGVVGEGCISVWAQMQMERRVRGESSATPAGSNYQGLGSRGLGIAKVAGGTDARGTGSVHLVFPK